jgi:hypothetical protein
MHLSYKSAVGSCSIKISSLWSPSPRSGTTGMTSRLRLFYAKTCSRGQTPGGIITHAYPYMHRKKKQLVFASQVLYNPVRIYCTVDLKVSFYLEDEDYVLKFTSVISCKRYTDKKENKIFLIYKEIQMGSGAKSYMKGFLIQYMRKCTNVFTIYEEVVSR